jgi:hypothetical protein
VVTLIKNFAEKIRIEVIFEHIVIEDEKDVEKHKFIGSPTVRINNLDIDPCARNIESYGFS